MKNKNMNYIKNVTIIAIISWAIVILLLQKCTH